MKQHIIVKLRAPLPGGADPPDWRTFIHDKSRGLTTLISEFDRLMTEAGMKFWVTREYRLSQTRGSHDEAEQGLDRTFRIILWEDHDVPDILVERVRQIPMVETARAIAVTETVLPPPQVATQASLSMRSAGELIHLGYARMLTKGRRDVVIAVLDTGVDANHPELRGKIAKGADFVNLEGLNTAGFVGDFLGLDDSPDDEVGHGTHVSGIIAAKGLKMDEGVAPGCSLMSVRVLATMTNNGQRVGAGIVDNINAGIKWAVDNGADVINMSLGIRHMGGGLPHEDIIRYALKKNVTVVAASGNDGTAEKYYPGALDGVWAVGATDDVGEIATFTSYGAPIRVVAPGSRIYSAFADGRYAMASGTSQAAPFVSGAVGLMKSFAKEHGRRLTNADLVRLFRHTSDRPDTRLRSPRTGYGLINLADAFKLLSHQLTGSSMRGFS